MNRQELHNKVRQTVHQLIHEKGHASPLDLLIKMGKITPKLVEEWRFGRVPYLERVLQGSLGQLSFIMEKFRQTAREMDLKESYTAYMRWGKGPKHPLRFSKSGNANIERHYATHFTVKKPKESLPVPVDEVKTCPIAAIESCGEQNFDRREGQLSHYI